MYKNLLLLVVGLAVAVVIVTATVRTSKQRTVAPEPANNMAQITNTKASATSPGGFSRLAFSRDGYVYLLDTKTGERRRLVKGDDPSLSPNGTTIAFTHRRDDKSEILLTVKTIDLESNKVTDFSSLDRYAARGAQWSPDGKYLALVIMVNSEWSIGVLNVADGSLTDVASGISSAPGLFFDSWASDKTVLCHDGDNLYELDLHGKIVRTIPLDSIASRSDMLGYERFSFSRDRKYLLFNNLVTPERPAGIFVYDLGERKLSRVTSEQINASDPQWLPGDKEIIFTRHTKDTQPAICVITIDGRNLRDLVEAGQRPTYAAQ